MIEYSILGLTIRQIEILNHVNKGLTYKEIAILLNVKASTIASHMNTMFRRTLTNNRDDLCSKYNDAKMRK